MAKQIERYTVDYRGDDALRFRSDPHGLWVKYGSAVEGLEEAYRDGIAVGRAEAKAEEPKADLPLDPHLGQLTTFLSFANDLGEGQLVRGLVRKMLAPPAEAVASVGWREMDSAPRDQSCLFVKMSLGGDEREVVEGHFHSLLGQFYSPACGMFTPLFWMPLPEPPK
jgi:hypothetical protein